MNRHLLVLDLDETLIFADEQPLDRAPDFEVAPYFVYNRPGLEAFLASMSGLYRIGVWTSSSPAYAEGVCSKVFGSELSLEFVWASDRCTPTRDLESDSWSQSKRLRKLRRKGYNLDSVLVVDDSPEKHTKNYGNLVQVAPYTGCAQDCELPALTQFLKALSVVPNVRAIEKRGWRRRVGAI